MRAVNLIPSEQRAGAGNLTGRSNGAALILIGLVLGVAVLAVFYGGAARQISSEQGETARLEAQTSVVQARIGRLAPYTSFVSMAEQRTKTVAQLVQARFDWSHALHELGRVLPGGASLTTFDGHVGSASGGGASTSTPASSTAAAGATATSSTPPGSTPTMALAGCAGSQSEVAETLQRLHLMDGVAEVQLQSSTKSGSSGSSSGGAGGSTGGGCATSFSAQVTFAPLPSTPVPTVAPTTPASTAAAAPARRQVSAQSKGAGK